MNISKYILKVLGAFPIVVFSWGTNNIRNIDNGIIFNVNGFIHKGDVKVLYDEGSDTFEVHLIDDDGNVKEKMTDVYVDSLVNTIDNAVEYCDNYEEVIMEYLNQ